MNNKALTLSLVFAAIAVFFVQSYVSSIEDAAKKKFGTEVLVIKARRDIREMETINETMLKFELVPKNYLEPAAITPPNDSAKEDKETTRLLKSLTGTIAVVPIKKDEQLTFNKLTDPSIRTGLASQVAPGRRAMAIPVSEFSSVSKLVKPGDRVDLIAVVGPDSEKTNKTARTVMQDVVVLSIGKNITNNVARVVELDPVGGKDRVRSLAEDFSFTSVTLEVEPAQAQALALLLNSGDNSLMLSLRNNEDVDRLSIPPTSLVDVFGAEFAKRAPPGQKK